MIRLLGRRVLLKVEAPAEKIGRIHLPEQARRWPQEGEVIAVGPEVSTVKLGDRVLFGRYSVLQVDPVGTVIWERDIMAVLDG